LVGAILGSIVVFSYLILPFDNLYKSILVSILYLFLYGFLHLEAVADTIDGYYASLSQKDVHKIMKEPQVGAMGAIGSFCFVLLKILAMGWLLYHHYFITIILALILSRFTLLFSLEFEFHTDSKFIHSLQQSFKLTTIQKIIFFPFYKLVKYILSKVHQVLGLLNGDTLGFTIELTEILYLNLFIFLVV